MNTGTKLRTILAIATSLNTALMATDVTGFNNPSVDMLYRVASIVLNFIVVTLVSWYNNDYTKVAAENTRVMRLQKKEDIPDEYFEKEEDHE